VNPRQLTTSPILEFDPPTMTNRIPGFDARDHRMVEDVDDRQTVVANDDC
jgi:hypothetical protein